MYLNYLFGHLEKISIYYPPSADVERSGTSRPPQDSYEVAGLSRPARHVYSCEAGGLVRGLRDGVSLR